MSVQRAQCVKQQDNKHRDQTILSLCLTKQPIVFFKLSSEIKPRAPQREPAHTD